MFKVGDRVRIKSDDEFDGGTGTVVLVTDKAGDDLNYIVDIDGHVNYDPFVEFITAIYDIPSSSAPFDLESLELLES